MSLRQPCIIQYRWIYSEGTGQWEYLDANNWLSDISYQNIKLLMKDIEEENFQYTDRWSGFEWHIVPEWQRDELIDCGKVTR